MNDQAEFDFGIEDTVSDYAISDTTDVYTISTNTNTLTTGSTIAATGIYTGSLLSANATTTSIGNYQYDILEEQKELKKSLTTIEKRLGILVPNEKLKEQYESLQSVYEQYLALEGLLYDGENNEQT